jgi:hypothetical protein
MACFHDEGAQGMNEILSACAQQMTQQNGVAFRDWLSLLALVAGICTFIWKLYADTKSARYRETVGFLEKRTAGLMADWKLVQKAVAEGQDFDDAAKSMLGMLDTVALLVKKKAFDKELVYNYWWAYFIDAKKNPAVEAWIKARHDLDKHVLEHFLELHAEFKKRCEAEQAQATITTAPAPPSA